ncbi:STAS/SEC14 domain-containing protein [Parvularcula oceani]|uniref:STAS/SEC14 domain-containing protein n=1 Tax=Parvularcula oceani TaxID=1247963 RepID=UPI00055ED1A7
MFQVLKGGRRDVLAARFFGQQGREELDKFSDWLEREVLERPDAVLLVVLDDFGGYRSFQTAVDDLKAGLRFEDRFARIAIVGDAGREQLMTTLSDPFAKATLQYFPKDGQGAALAWLRS